MRSRELPAFRSLRFAWPEVVVDERDDHVLLRTPPGAISSSGEALVLDEPPEHLGPWLLRAGGADLMWEDRLESSRPVAAVGPTRATPAEAPVPDGHVREVFTCWLHDQAMDPDPPEGTRPMDPGEQDAAIGLLVAAGWASEVARWQLGQHLRLAGEGLAAVLATGPRGAPTGVVSVAWNGREARLMSLAVDPRQRGAGLGRKLVAAAATEWQAVSFGLLYAVVAPGSAAEGALRASEMRPVTSVWRIRSSDRRT